MQLKTDSQKIEKNGWKQGSCLLINNASKVKATIQDVHVQLKEGLYIVLSQDCDILNNSLEKEPMVELVLTDRIEKCNAEFTSGKNPRRLHLISTGNEICLEILPHRRLFISRTYLEVLHAEKITVSGQPLKVLVNWIAKRYRRPGFPNEFNTRIKSKAEEIKQILSSKAKNTLGLFIRLSSENDLKPNKTYRVLVKMLVNKATYEAADELLEIEKGFDLILSLLDKVKGIKIIEGSQVQSMDDITMHDYQQLKQWDFDYISFLNDESGETVNNIII